MSETVIDRWRDLRVSAGLLVIVLFTLFGLLRSITMMVQLVAGGPPDGFYIRRVLFQAIADVPFTFAAVLAIQSMRTRDRVRSRQRLLWAAVGLTVAFGLLFLGLLTESSA